MYDNEIGSNCLDCGESLSPLSRTNLCGDCWEAVHEKEKKEKAKKRKALKRARKKKGSFEELHFKELQQMYLDARTSAEAAGITEGELDDAVQCAVMQELCCRFLERISGPFERSKTALFVTTRTLAEAGYDLETATAFATKYIQLAFESESRP